MSTPFDANTVAVRVSPVRSLLKAAGCRVVDLEGVQVSGDGPGRRGLADLSTCDRMGLKGRAAPAWLASAGVAMPPQPNRLVEGGDGLVVARLSDTEFALADFRDATSPRLQALRAELEATRPDGCYGVPRAESQAAFGLEGDWIPAALSALCPADLRVTAFPPGSVLQTLCAGVGAQVWNLSSQGLERAVLTCDASLAAHVWCALHHAVTMAGGSIGSQAGWFVPR